jgi:ATP-binding cassette subfamily F protein 3
MSPLETLIWDMDMEPQPARDLLGRFLFSGDDVYRPMRTLSGGEKNKMSLAKLTQLNPNLLVLDEPTNHLDMASREALANVLKQFSGTLILISHDRWLLSQVTDQTLDIRKSGPVVFPGSYPEYRRRLEAPGTTHSKSRQSGSGSHAVVVAEPPKVILSPRERSKEIQRLTKLVSDAEQLVGDIESEIKRMEVKLAAVGPTEDVYGLTLQYQAAKERLDGAIAVWEEQARNLEAMGKE